MTTETQLAVVAAAMEAQGATNSFMYKRAKAIAEGQPDPMPTSPAAPLSISPLDCGQRRELITPLTGFSVGTQSL